MVVLDTCNCTTWELETVAPAVRFCREHHRYHRGAQQLVSVTKVLKGIWPIKPDYSQAQPDVLENARDRGIAVDELFSSYINGTLDRIPAGTRQDAVELFFKARRWWDGRKHEHVMAQALLADNEVAGTCDVLADDCIYDLKATHDIECTYPLQLAAYAELHFATFQRPVKKLGIIHVTKRYAEPKIIQVDLAEVLPEWMTVRQMWKLVTKRTKKDLP